MRVSPSSARSAPGAPQRKSARASSVGGAAGSTGPSGRVSARSSRSGVKSSTRKDGRGERLRLADRRGPRASSRRSARRGRSRRRALRPPAPWSGSGIAGVFDAVGAGDDRGEGQAFDRPGAVVAGEDGGEDGLARAVGAALGGGEDVDRQRRRAAGDAAVGEVEAGLGEVQEGVVRPASAVTRPASAPPRPRRSPGSKRTWPSASVVAAPRTSLLRARSFTSTPGRAVASERPRRKTCRPSAPVSVARPRSVTTNHWVAEASQLSPRRRAGDAGGQRVEAGREAGDDLAHRQRRGDVVVQLLPELARALPDRLAEGVAQAGLLVAGQRAAEVAVAEDRRDVAGADAVELRAPPRRR